MPSPQSLTAKEKKKLKESLKRSLGVNQAANMNTIVAMLESTKGNPFASMTAKGKAAIPESEVLSFILGKNSSRNNKGVKKASVYNVIQNIYEKKKAKIMTKKAKRARENQEFRNFLASVAAENEAASKRQKGGSNRTRKARRSS